MARIPALGACAPGFAGTCAATPPRHAVDLRRDDARAHDPDFHAASALTKTARGVEGSSGPAGRRVHADAFVRFRIPSSCGVVTVAASCNWISGARSGRGRSMAVKIWQLTEDKSLIISRLNGYLAAAADTSCADSRWTDARYSCTAPEAIG
jgi:hypothetical protein